MLITLFLIALVIVSVSVTGYIISAPGYSGTASDHFDGKKFFSPGGAPARGLPDVLKWMINRQRGPWEPVNIMPPAGESHGTGVRITFVNHSTFLIEVDGLNILTDPVWSERVSPFSFIGPKRLRPPGIRFEELPRIDVVLLSHNHYDHLDLETMKRIVRTHNPRIVTPLGVKAFLDAQGITGATDLDWWDEYTVREDLKVVSTPAQHFSGRGMFDRDATLWCGFLLIREAGNIYFAGDSGYHESMFKEIGVRGAPIHLSLIPLGAYKPEWFMSPVHCSPAEAARIHLDVGSHRSVGMHFGTFPLADEGSHELLQDFEEGLKKYDVPPGDFILLAEGEPAVF